VDAEARHVGQRRRAHVEPGVVDGERRLGGRRGAAEAREVRRAHGHDARNRSRVAHHGDALALEHLLVEERLRQRAGHAPQADVAVVGDVADDVSHLVQGAARKTLRLTLAQHQRHVAEAVAGGTRQPSEQGIGERTLRAGDRSHGGQALGQGSDVLSRKATD